MRLKTMIAATAVAASALFASAAGGMLEPGGSPELSVSSSAKTKKSKLTIVRSDFGRILANGRGRALYVFTSDSGKTSSCYGDCARAWPPYIVRSKPRAIDPARPRLIGTTRRSDGRLQATYDGHPVYYYVGDDAPGEVLCQAVEEFGGLWYVIRASGRVVR